MYLLLGKYESNAIALKLYADTCDEVINTYDQLVTLIQEQRGENALIMWEINSFRVFKGTIVTIPVRLLQ